MPADQPSDAGARREMERLVWAAAFARAYDELLPKCNHNGREATKYAVEEADWVAAAYREHGPTR